MFVYHIKDRSDYTSIKAKLKRAFEFIESNDLQMKNQEELRSTAMRSLPTFSITIPEMKILSITKATTVILMFNI